MILFPALRSAIAARGFSLPTPYPHTRRTVVGSALAALLSGLVLGFLFLLWTAVSTTITFASRTIDSFSQPTEQAEAVATPETKKPLASPSAPPSGAHAEHLPRVESSSQVQNNWLPLPAGSVWLESRAPFLRSPLPYAEFGRLPLSDAARQVDFALLQTVRRLGLERGRILFLTSELRERGEESYHFQRIRIYLPPVAAEAAEGHQASGPTAVSASQTQKNSAVRSGETPPPQRLERIAVDAQADFVGTLAECLDAWASRGILKEQGNHILLSTGGVLTHEIWLETTTSAFLPTPPHQPFSTKPRIALVLLELGKDAAEDAAVLKLSLPFSAGFIPGPTASNAAEELWNRGGDILLQYPMRSSQWPYIKAGAEELTPEMNAEEMSTALKKALLQVPHAAGLTSLLGSGLLNNANAVANLCESAAVTGLFLFESGRNDDSLLAPQALRQGLPLWTSTVQLDTGHPPAYILRKRLKDAEAQAMRGEAVIILAHPYPETLDVLQEWGRERNAAIELVPLRHISRLDR